MEKYTLPKNEKLKSLKLIQQIFQERMSVKAYPFVAVYKQIERQESPVLFGVSVSKKAFKKAVDRNRIKRLTREAYRTQKELLAELDDSDFTIAVMFIFVGKEMPDFDLIRKGVNKTMIRLINKVICKNE